MVLFIDFSEVFVPLEAEGNLIEDYVSLCPGRKKVLSYLSFQAFLQLVFQLIPYLRAYP